LAEKLAEQSECAGAITEQQALEQRNTLFTSIILVGISSLITEEEIFYLLSDKITENSEADEQQCPKPLKVILFDKNDVENNGIALVNYRSFNEAMEAKQLLNQSHKSKFFGPDFEGAILAEPPIHQLLYKTIFYNESDILKRNKVPFSGSQMIETHRPLCEAIVQEIDSQMYSFYQQMERQELVNTQKVGPQTSTNSSQGNTHLQNQQNVPNHQYPVYIPLVDYSSQNGSC
jgi:hypothetical protein